MKPTFALDLTAERIALLHRSGRGWAEVGAVTFGDPELDAAMAVLRATAAEMSPRGITTKLILPDSEILYTRVPVTGATDAARRAEVAAALEGMTPYAVADLAFDIAGAEGGMVEVAAVARETLAQAEGFATQHRLNPVSFVGEAAGGWPTEPYFGTTSVAAEILGKGGRVTRDTAPVLTRAPAPQPEAPAPVAAEADAADAGDGTIPAEASVADRAAAMAADPEPSLAAPEAEPGVAADLPPSDAVASGELMPVEPEPAPLPAAEPDQPAEPAPVLTFTAPRPPADPDEAPFTHVGDSTVPDLLPEAAPADLPPAPAPAAMVAFASRRSNAAPKAAPPPGTVAERLAQRAAALSQTGRVVPPAPPRNFSAFEPAARRRPAEGEAPARTEAPAAPPPGAEVVPFVPAAVTAATTTQPPVATLPRMQPTPPRKSLTKPGGTFATAAPARGRPRYLGLILTGVLLAFLALVAAWASFFLEARNGGADDAAPVAAADVAPALAAAPIDIASAAPPPQTDLAAAAPPAAVAAAPVPAPPLAEPAPAAAAPVEPVAAGPPPAGAPDETTSAALPAPVQDGGDRIVISTAEAPPAPPDAPALAATVPVADALPAPQMPPPAFGTVYQFDAAGRIVPTPDGILTPEGVRLFAGPPPQVPPARPAEVAAAAAALAPVPDTPADPAALPPDGVTAVGADPALAGARPLPRPEGLAPPPDAAPDAAPGDDAGLAAAGPTRLASPRPPARPASITAAAEALAAAAAAEEQARRDAASLAAQAAAEAAVASVVSEAAVAPSGSALAVSVSRVPAPRPRSLERAVAAAVSAATRAAPPAEAPATAAPAAAAPTPEAEDEPEVASAVPAAPTRAGVAEQATFNNAISLREMNLIGVYGTDANRRALVRQANGRYREVEVGDRLDGGVVAQITDDELRYQKGGRTLALEMPGG
jgi:hypothetical protein